MNMHKPLKCAAAVLSGIIVMTNFSGTAIAETSLSGSETTAVITTAAETTSVTAAKAGTADAKQDSEAKSEKTDWWKAEITDYDSSLSLISYEITPDKTETEDEENKDSSKDSAEVNPASGKVIAAPIPVESQTTGGYIGDIPEGQGQAAIDAQPGQFAFVTYGWGHGVGMSQNGANFYAMYSGWSYQDILFHYYPGTYLMNTGTAETEQVTVNGVTGDVLSMVAGIVEREVGPSMSTETIKAQAVAVYTYIKYHGDNSRDLRCKENPSQTVIDACASVLGEALYYDGDYALTMFCASSGGATANCRDVFTNDIPYLTSVPSDYDAAYDPHYGTVNYFDSSEVKRLVESRYGISLSENPGNWFQLSQGDGGYVTQVVIDGQITVKGEDLYVGLGLKSPKFEVYYAG